MPEQQLVGLFEGTPLVDFMIKRKKLIKSERRDRALLKLKTGVTEVKKPTETAKILVGTALGFALGRL